MADIPSPAPQTPLQPEQGVPTPSSPQPAPVSHHHKEFFIIGSVFTVLMLLAVSGMLYFQNYSNKLVAQDLTQVVVGPILDSLGQPTGYEKDNQNIYFIDKDTEGKSIVVGADPKTFSVIYGNYGPVEAPINANSANWLFHALGKDSQYVYSDSSIVDGSDAATFIAIRGGENFYKDKNTIYYFNPKQGLSSLPDVDPNTFEIRTDLPDDQGQIYFSSDKNHVYQLSNVIEGADPNTFEIIKNGEGKPTQYEKDKSNIYFLDKKVSGADYLTFSIPNPYPSGNNFFNAQDKNHKYLNGQVVGTTSPQNIPESADPATYHELDSKFAADSTHVWGINTYGDRGPILLDGVDPKTLVLHVNFANVVDSANTYAKDATHLLYRPYPSDVTPAGGFEDFNSLEFIADTFGFNRYIQDKKAVYFSGYPFAPYKKINAADPASFSLLGPGKNKLVDGREAYAKDKSHVYFGTQLVDGVDPTTFAVVSVNEQSTYDAQDKNHKYLNGKVVQ